MKHSLSMTALATILGAALPAHAQTVASSTGLDEVVVTAQKRSENLQTVPIAISAFTAADIADGGLVRSEEIANRVPNLFLATGNSVGTTRLNIRGVSSEPNNVGLENAIPTYMDGVAQGPGRSISSGLFDVRDIEVLRGPQGTLFGRNSVGGAILVRTNQPSLSKFGGYVQGEAGDYNDLGAQGAINLPLSDKIAIRIAGDTQKRDGFTQNTTLNTNQNNLSNSALRAQALVQLTPDLSMTLRVDTTRDKSNGNVKDFGPTSLGGPNYAGARDFSVSTDFPVKTSRAMSSAGAEIDYTKNGYRFVSLTDFGWFNYYNFDDADFTSANVLNTGSAVQQHQFSQELRVESPTGDRVNWVAGLYYFSEGTSVANSAAGQFATFGGAPNATTFIPIGSGSRITSAFAPFGQVNFHLTDKLTFTAGARYTDESGSADKFQPSGLAALGIPALRASASTSDKQWSGDFKASYEFTKDFMGYASFSRGFKGSGFNLNPGTLISFTAKPEFVNDYEGGVRTQWFERRLRINATAFYYDYTNLQRSTYAVPPGGGVAQIVFGNAGGTVSKGFELETEARPIPSLLFGGTLGLVDAKFTNYVVPGTTQNYNGLIPARTPQNTGSAFAEYTYSVLGIGDLTLRVDYLHRAKSYAQDTDAPAFMIDPVDIANLRGGLRAKDGNWDISAWVKNLTNKHYAEDVITASGFTPGVGLSMAAPRTYGVTLRKSF